MPLLNYALSLLSWKRISYITSANRQFGLCLCWQPLPLLPYLFFRHVTSKKYIRWIRGNLTHLSSIASIRRLAKWSLTKRKSDWRKSSSNQTMPRTLIMILTKSRNSLCTVPASFRGLMKINFIWVTSGWMSSATASARSCTERTWWTRSSIRFCIRLPRCRWQNVWISRNWTAI